MVSVAEDDTANLVKIEKTYDKLTHKEEQRVTRLKEIEIPKTVHETP